MDPHVLLQADSLGIADLNSFKNVVKWLENRKIRFYTPEDRVLLDNTQDVNWSASFCSYVADLGGSSNVTIETTDDRTQILDWLLSYAVGMEYSDRAEELQKVQTVAASGASSSNGEQTVIAGRVPCEEVEIELDLGSAEFKENLQSLAACLGVPNDDSIEAMLRTCATILEQKLSVRALQQYSSEKAAEGSAKDGQADVGRRKRNKGRCDTDLSHFTCGFDTGDAAVNKAASVLRMLYVGDLRRLQDRINGLVSEMQDYTANPKTDSSLGRVGK